VVERSPESFKTFDAAVEFWRISVKTATGNAERSALDFPQITRR